MSINLAAIVDKPWPFVRGYLTQEMGLGDRLDNASDAFVLGYLSRASGLELRHVARFDKECGASYIPDQHTCHVSGGRSPKAAQSGQKAVKEIIASTEFLGRKPLPESSVKSLKQSLANEIRSAVNKYGDEFAKHLIVDRFGFGEDDLGDAEGQLNNSLFRHGVDQLDGKAVGSDLVKALDIESDINKIKSGRQKRQAKEKSVTDGVESPDSAATKYLDDFFKGMSKSDREEFTVSLAEDRKKHRGDFGKEFLRGVLLGDADEDGVSAGFISAGIDQLDSQKLNNYLLSQRQVNSTASKRKRKI